MSLALISIAGVATRCFTNAEVTSGEPGRLSTATSAKRATSSAARQRGSSAAASAPRISTSRSSGHRSFKIRSVSTVYDGPARSSSIVSMA